MNEQDIELAKRAGMIPDKYGMFFAKDYHEDGVDVEKLIELIRADEREACAKLVLDIAKKASSITLILEAIAEQIRARGNT